MACSTGCSTPGSHRSYGECMRSKGAKVAYANSAKNLDATAQKRWDKELDLYRQARSEGLQPATTKRKDIETAMAISDKTGKAFRAK